MTAAARSERVEAGGGPLDAVDWSFTTVPAAHPIHGLHAYPAKFVAALPREVIARLTRPGDLVADPFCGSGTALAEALLAGRRAVGSDLNPVAVTVARAKTRRLGDRELERLAELATRAPEDVRKALEGGTLALPDAWHPVAGQRFRGLSFWFDEQVAYELAALRSLIQDEPDEHVRTVAFMCFSAIVVAVSRQDSDTRYVRREKGIQSEETVRQFARRIELARAALAEFSSSTTQSAEVHSCDAREITYLQPSSVRLVVTSPPYPNAWSYHLYHQNRILWLDEDPWAFKASEIGHHRAYSAKQGQGADDFEADMARMFAGVVPALTADGHAVVVVGDSIVRGAVIRNDETVERAASRAGLRLTAAFRRVIDPRRKAFNPSIGKIRTEHVLVFGRE